MNWLVHIRVKDKYTLDEREVSEGKGVLVRRVLCIEYVFGTMFISHLSLLNINQSKLLQF